MQPPKRAISFLRWFCREDYIDEIEGDLTEIFYKTSRSSPRTAKLKFSWQVLRYFRPEFIKSFKTQPSNPLAMYSNYFKVGLRNLLRNFGYSSLNISGLALGMAVAMIIALWVYDELAFNKYYKNYDKIAQITKGGSFEGKYYRGQRYMPYPLIEELRASYGQNFKHIVPVSNQSGFDAVLSVGDKKITRNGTHMGEGGPEMFSLEMESGSWSGLVKPHSIMISSSTAKAFFGEGEALGKSLKINNDKEVVVTGVYKDIPRNAEFYGLHFLQPWSMREIEAPWMKEQGWDNHFLQIYVEIAPNKSMQEAGANIRKAEMKVIENLDYMKGELQYDYDILLQPMKDWHLYSNYKEGQLQTGPVQFVWFIGSIGVFVLILACINFMNLSTARSEKRAKEVGIRKAVGSVRSQLVAQFFSESFLVVIFSFVLATALVYLCLPWFNQLSAKAMVIPFTSKWFWICGLGFVFLTGFIAGSYPAIYLSSFKPISVLKGVVRAGKMATLPRKVLVIIQFTVSVILVICTASIYQQLMFVKDRPVGYDREGLMMIQKKSGEFDTQAEALRAELKKTGVVTEVGEAGGYITSGTWSHNGGFNWEGKDPSFDANFATLNVSPLFGKTVGWKVIDGRDFSEDIAGDSAAIILNRSAAAYMKLADPVGKSIRWTNRAWGVDQDFRIVGIVDDMIMNSPFEPVKPAIYMTYGYESVLMLRVAPGVAMSDALPKIESVFNRLIPTLPFDYSFADQRFATKFSNEERIGQLAALFATLAIVISCLGLFGLASFVAEQRTKEIGIRKVMGASVTNLWRMLSQEFVLLVFISSAIAIPISYYILVNAVKNYEYRTDLSWWTFAAAALGALVITLATVSFQAVKAALANPIRSIRNE